MNQLVTFRPALALLNKFKSKPKREPHVKTCQYQRHQSFSNWELEC